MKKLIMFIGVAALAFAGQAASVDWGVSVASQGAAWSGTSAYVMAFNGSDYDAVIKLLTVTGSDNMATDLGGYALALGAGGTQASVSNNRGSAKASGTSDGVTGDKMFWVVFTEGSKDAGKAITWTAATDISAYDYEAGSPAPGTISLNAASFANSGTIAGVPEPTSGLLMLVGLAGLALRRRRA
ncbi:MAG: PEP-CTERM sorting domain-containing protein [Verrucomicrobiota bacterium]|nr:PEP-CTERM sorting domain-containing protein [Verrucomicrobiota bacterium]